MHFASPPNTGPRKGWAGGDACMRTVHLVLLARTSHGTALRKSIAPPAAQPGFPPMTTVVGTATPASKDASAGVENNSPLWVEAITGVPSALTAPEWGFNDALLGGNPVLRVRDYSRWVIETVFFKMITAEDHGISAVEVAVEVSRNLAARCLRAKTDIHAIRIRTQQPIMAIIKKTGPLQNAADRDHCLQYMVAVTLLKGSVIQTLDYMDDSPWATDSRVDLLRERTIVVEDAVFTQDYYNPEKRSGANATTVELINGEVLDEVVVEFPVGHPRRDDTAEQVLNKFRDNMRLLFHTEEVETIIRALENDAMPVHEFVGLFTR